MADESQLVENETPDMDQPPMPEIDPVKASAPAEESVIQQTAEDSVASIRAAAAAELERISQIRQICNGRNPAVEAQAIREGWDEQRTDAA